MQAVTCLLAVSDKPHQQGPLSSHLHPQHTQLTGIRGLGGRLTLSCSRSEHGGLDAQSRIQCVSPWPVSQPSSESRLGVSGLLRLMPRPGAPFSLRLRPLELARPHGATVTETPTQDAMHKRPHL